MPKPKIDYEKCTACGTCVEVCPVDVFEKKGDKVEVAKPDECIGCRACEAQCPAKAIIVED
jgi:NAD-dependent dihydropyrimidine dehydrogenase PreA subunit|tara:strand:+ start:242 stop:424 length:183 start_codon:yes stop_codon:yes gene_type:complete